MTEGHRTVSRILGILETVVQHPEGSTLARLTEVLDAPRSTIYGFVRGLLAEGYLEELEGTGGYVLGIGGHTFLASAGTSLVEVMLPVMQEILTELNETVTLSVPVGRDIAYVACLQSTHHVTYSPPLHQRRHPWPTSTGKIFLAHGAFSGAWLPGEVDEQLGPSALEELAVVRRRGFATNVGESVTDVAAVAVGVQVSGRMVAALSVGGPRARIEDHLMSAAELTMNLLQQRGLGGRP